MNYVLLISKILESQLFPFALYFVLAFETVILNYSVEANPSKYDGGTIINGEFLKELRKKTLNPVEENRQEGQFKEAFEMVIKHFNLENLRTFYTNLQTLKMKSTLLPIIRGAEGSYNEKDNVITYSLNRSFIHEILHMGSTYYDSENEVLLSGFSQKKGKTRMGNAINEGYTELLASRIENRKLYSYKSQSKIAKMIEYFFDDPKEMESLYMNYDLPGLVDHMSKFTSREEFLKIIVYMDINDSTIPFIFIPPISSISAQVKLYEWFQKNCRDEEKLEAFRKLVFINPLVGAIIKGKEIKLCRGSSSKPQRLDKIEINEPDLKNINTTTEISSVVTPVFSIFEQQEAIEKRK
jgi:hypothetical protein